MTYVYVIQGANDHIQIGVAADPAERLAFTQTRNPNAVAVAHQVWFKNWKKAKAALAALQHKFKDRHVIRMWYAVPADEMHDQILPLQEESLGISENTIRMHGGICGYQVRLARSKISMSQDYLACVTGLSLATISKVEHGTVTPRAETLEVIRAYFEGRGLEFTAGSGERPGVQWKTRRAA